MKKMTIILGLVSLISTVAFANPSPMKIIVVDSESLHKATVSEEQFAENAPTRHIYNGKVVDREIAKDAFLRGETTCRVFVNGQTQQLPDNTAAELVMEGPAQNRTMLLFYNQEREAFFSLVCQAQANEITRSSIVKTLGSLIKAIE